MTDVSCGYGLLISWSVARRHRTDDRRRALRFAAACAQPSYGWRQLSPIEPNWNAAGSVVRS